MGGPLRMATLGEAPSTVKRTGQRQEEQLLVDAAEKRCHTREASSEKTSFLKSSTAGKEKNI